MPLRAARLGLADLHDLLVVRTELEVLTGRSRAAVIVVHTEHGADALGLVIVPVEVAEAGLATDGPYVIELDM